MKINFSQFKYPIRKTLALGFCILALLTPGCSGGGTSGTGGDVQIGGAFRTVQGSPIPGVTVNASAVTPVRAQGADSSTAVTDANGNFTVTVNLEPTEVPKLTFEGSGINSDYVISNVPAGTKIVVIDLEYDDENGDVHEGSVKFEDEDGNDIGD